MTNGIEIELSQRCGGEHGQDVYFARDCVASFSMDGNSDNAQMMAGCALAGMIRAHRGDTLLIVIRLHGHMVARWIGEATNIAADEFEAFCGGRMYDFAHTARRIIRERAPVAPQAWVLTCPGEDGGRDALVYIDGAKAKRERAYLVDRCFQSAVLRSYASHAEAVAAAKATPGLASFADWNEIESNSYDRGYDGERLPG